MNISEVNKTSELDYVMPLVPSVLMSSTCGTAILFNITVCVVTVKVMKKEFHTLLISSLCASECVLNLSFIFDILQNTFPSTRTNLRLCLSSNFFLAFSMTLVYSFILLLSIERYLTIKSYNFGMKQTFNNRKILLISLVPCLAFLTSFITLIIPYNRTITACRPHILYKDSSIYYYLYGSVSTSVASLIVCITLHTAYYIWKIFFCAENKIEPSNLEGGGSTETNQFEMIQKATEISSEISICSKSVVRTTQPSTSSLTNGVPRSKLHMFEDQETTTQDDISNDIDIINIDSVSTIGCPNKSDQPRSRLEIPPATIEDTKIDINEINIEFSDKMESEIEISPTIRQTRIAPPSKLFLGQKSNEGISNDDNRPKHIREWELRAFMTSLVIALSLAVFTTPTIAILWNTALSGSHPSQEMHAYTTFLCVLNSIFDPALFVWRTPIIRERFKNVFKKNSS